MKQIILSILCLSSIIAYAGVTDGNRESYSLANDNYSGLCIETPVMREIYGGTVINVTYDNSCPVELQSAFSYACKIWEENMPTCLPINISVSVGRIRTSGQDKALSKVSMPTINSSTTYYWYASPRTMIKGIVLEEFHRGNNISYLEEIENADFFDKEDISIVYNEDCLDEFSYNLEPLAEVGYYDFVTLALRDIAAGLGFRPGFLADNSNNKIIFTGENLTPFETLVYEAMETEDPLVAYKNCTQGELDVKIYSTYGSFKLYAPNPWVNGLSLQYCIPDETKPLTQLLSYDFSKGTVIRNIADDYKYLFPHALGWQPNFYVGGASNSAKESGSSLNILPFKGNISIPSNSSNSYSNNTSPVHPSPKKYSSNTNFDITEYCKPYYYGGDYDNRETFTISVLLKDGTWDVIHRGSFSGSKPIESMNLNHDIEQYARTCDGLLRYRFTTTTRHLDELYGFYYYKYDVKYYAREYTPQKAYIKYSGLYEPSTYTRSANGDDYWVDIKVGIKNLEGTTRVVVEQLDDGELLPFSYDVEDFKRGYFVATVDKDFPTQFTVISYNENGTTRSNTITVPPVSETIDQGNINIKIGKHQIIVDTDKLNLEKISYRIDHLSPVQTVIPIKRLANDGIIDISQLQKGAYALTLFEDGEYKTSEKFMH